MKISKRHYFKIFEISIVFKPSIQIKFISKLGMSRKQYFEIVSKI